MDTPPLETPAEWRGGRAIEPVAAVVRLVEGNYLGLGNNYKAPTPLWVSGLITLVGWSQRTGQMDAASCAECSARDDCTLQILLDIARTLAD